MSPRIKKPVGMAAILLAMVGWIVAVVSGIDMLRPVPVWAEIILYAIAGMVWILPFRPLLAWMNRP